jgi:anti-sigma B factor antagonist
VRDAPVESALAQDPLGRRDTARSRRTSTGDGRGKAASDGVRTRPAGWLLGGDGGGEGHRISVCHAWQRVPVCMDSCKHDIGAWLNARRDKLTPRVPGADQTEAWRGGFVDLKLDDHMKDGIRVVDVEGEIDVYTAPRLRELLIELVNKGDYQLVVNMEKVEFLDSTGLGVLVGGLKRVRAHDGSLDLVCRQERILKIFRITGLTKVFGIHDTVDEAIKARKSEK